MTGLALGGAPAADPPLPACAASGSGAAVATTPIGAAASGAAAAARGFAEQAPGAEPAGTRGLPLPAGVAVPPRSERTGEARRTRAQRLVSAQLDAMVARAAEPVPDGADAGGDADSATEAFPDPASGELQQETARAVLAGMLEGFAGVPPRAQGSPDAATEP